MSDETSSESGNWRTRLLIRVLHVIFMLTRGMTLGVRAACFDSEGRVFLVRHSYIPGWHLPGGGLERNEATLEGLAKELREEGNLKLTEPARLIHVYFNRRTSKRDHVIFFRCDNVVQTEAKRADHEIVESGFFALDALPAGTTAATRRRLAELGGTTPIDDIW